MYLNSILAKFSILKYLLQAANVGLNDLDVSWNAIRQKGAVAIAKALQVSYVQEI